MIKSSAIPPKTYFNKETHLDKKDFDMIELCEMKKSYSSEESQSYENDEHSTKSDSLKKSYFLQKVKYDGIDDQETLLEPDIHRTIFAFIDPNDYENISRVNKVTKKFISSNFRYKNCLLELKSVYDIDKFMTYLKDKNNNQFLSTIKILSLSLDIDLEISKSTELLDKIQSLSPIISETILQFNESVNQSINQITDLPKDLHLFSPILRSNPLEFKDLVNQLENSPIKELHLKFTKKVNSDFIKYLANSNLSCLTVLDLSMTNVNKKDILEVTNGNLKLQALGLKNKSQKSNECIMTFKTNNKKQIKLYIRTKSCLNLNYEYGYGEYFGELTDDGIPHGYGEYQSYKIRYQGEWIDGKIHGHGNFCDDMGNTYYGEWVNGKKHGHGIYRTHTKSWNYRPIRDFSVTYEGEWKNGKKHGKFIFRDNKGNMYDQEWENNKIIKSERRK